jgi:hypothetical protein
MNKNLNGLIFTILTAVLAIWVGPTVDASTPTSGKIAQSIVVALGLAFSVYRMDQVRHIFIASCGGVLLALTFVPKVFHIPTGSAFAIALPLASAVLTNINTAFLQQEKTIVSPSAPSLVPDIKPPAA